MPHHYAATVFYCFHYKVHKTNKIEKGLNHVGQCNLEAKGTGLAYWIGYSEEVHRSYNMYPVNLLTHFRNPWYRVFPSKRVRSILRY